MSIHSSPRGESGSGQSSAGGGRNSDWSGGPPSDWDEIRARLRSYHDQVAGRADSRDDEPAAPVTGNGVNGKAAHIIRPAAVQRPRRIPAETPTPDEADFGTVFDLPVIRWWQVHNPLVMQRAVLVLCVMLALLLLLQAF